MTVTLFTFGCGALGELGLSRVEEVCRPEATAVVFPSPALHSGGNEISVTGVALGTDHSLALVGGRPYRWGLLCNTQAVARSAAPASSTCAAGGTGGGCGGGGVETTAAVAVVASSGAVLSPAPLSEWCWRGESGSGTCMSQELDGMVRAVVCGGSNSFLLTRDGAVFVLGDLRPPGSNPSQLRRIWAGGHFFSDPGPGGSWTPRPRVARIAAGWRHCLLLVEGGSVYAVGDDEHGQCAGANDGSSSLPLPTLEAIIGISAGACHSTAWDNHGVAFSWGHGGSGRLGLGGTKHRRTPTAVEALSEAVCLVSCGANFTIFVANEGRSMWACGGNQYGQLGLNEEDTTAQEVPVQVEFPGTDDEVVDVDCGVNHTLCLTRPRSHMQASGHRMAVCIQDERATAWAWGCAASGQCGRAVGERQGSMPPACRWIPEPLADFLPPLPRWPIAVAAGRFHSAVLARVAKPSLCDKLFSPHNAIPSRQATERSSGFSPQQFEFPMPRSRVPRAAGMAPNQPRVDAGDSSEEDVINMFCATLEQSSVVSREPSPAVDTSFDVATWKTCRPSTHSRTSFSFNPSRRDSSCPSTDWRASRFSGRPSRSMSSPSIHVPQSHVSLLVELGEAALNSPRESKLQEGHVESARMRRGANGARSVGDLLPELNSSSAEWDIYSSSGKMHAMKGSGSDRVAGKSSSSVGPKSKIITAARSTAKRTPVAKQSWTSSHQARFSTPKMASTSNSRRHGGHRGYVDEGPDGCDFRRPPGRHTRTSNHPSFENEAHADLDQTMDCDSRLTSWARDQWRRDKETTRSPHPLRGTWDAQDSPQEPPPARSTNGHGRLLSTSDDQRKTAQRSGFTCIRTSPQEQSFFVSVPPSMGSNQHPISIDNGMNVVGGDHHTMLIRPNQSVPAVWRSPHHAQHGYGAPSLPSTSPVRDPHYSPVEDLATAPTIFSVPGYDSQRLRHSPSTSGCSLGPSPSYSGFTSFGEDSRAIAGQARGEVQKFIFVEQHSGYSMDPMSNAPMDLPGNAVGERLGKPAAVESIQQRYLIESSPVPAAVEPVVTSVLPTSFDEAIGKVADSDWRGVRDSLNDLNSLIASIAGKSDTEYRSVRVGDGSPRPLDNDKEKAHAVAKQPTPVVSPRDSTGQHSTQVATHSERREETKTQGLSPALSDDSGAALDFSPRSDAGQPTRGACSSTAPAGKAELRDTQPAKAETQREEHGKRLCSLPGGVQGQVKKLEDSRSQDAQAENRSRGSHTASDHQKLGGTHMQPAHHQHTPRSATSKTNESQGKCLAEATSTAKSLPEEAGNTLASPATVIGPSTDSGQDRGKREKDMLASPATPAGQGIRQALKGATVASSVDSVSPLQSPVRPMPMGSAIQSPVRPMQLDNISDDDESTPSRTPSAPQQQKDVASGGNAGAGPNALENSGGRRSTLDSVGSGTSSGVEPEAALAKQRAGVSDVRSVSSGSSSTSSAAPPSAGRGRQQERPVKAPSGGSDSSNSSSSGRSRGRSGAVAVIAARPASRSSSGPPSRTSSRQASKGGKSVTPAQGSRGRSGAVAVIPARPASRSSSGPPSRTSSRQASKGGKSVTPAEGKAGGVKHFSDSEESSSGSSRSPVRVAASNAGQRANTVATGSSSNSGSDSDRDPRGVSKAAVQPVASGRKPPSSGNSSDASPGPQKNKAAKANRAGSSSRGSSSSSSRHRFVKQAPQSVVSTPASGGFVKPIFSGPPVAATAPAPAPEAVGTTKPSSQDLEIDDVSSVEGF